MDVIMLDLGDAIKGGSMIEGFVGKIEVMSYSHNVAMQVTNDVSNKERTSGRPHIGEFTITKFVDGATPALNEYCCAGKEIPSAVISCGRGGGDDDESTMPLIVYTLSNVIISNISVSGGSGGNPVETLALNFTKIKWELAAQGSNGSKQHTSTASWDLAANKV